MKAVSFNVLKTLSMYSVSFIFAGENTSACLAELHRRAVNLFPQTLNLSLIWDVWFAGCGLQ